MKNSLFKKLLLFILVTLLVYAALTAGAFTYTSRMVFANTKAGQLTKSAYYISAIVAQYQRGEISGRFLEYTLNSDRSLFDAAVHVFQADGSLMAGPAQDDGGEMQSRLRVLLPGILEGGNNRIMATDELGIVVAVPVYGLDAAILGAVFLTKPLDEVNAALNGLNTALFISTAIVLLLMLLPTFLWSKRFTNPLMQMSNAAREMARGNFNVRAEDARKDEIGILGRALNELSSTLSETIGDLMLERNRLRNMLDGMREGIIALDEAQNVTHCNPAALLLLSCNTPEAALKLLYTLSPALKDSLLLEQAQESITLKERELKVTVTALQNAYAKRVGAVMLLQDVTEERRLEQTRREYVANVSHELRTPIASICGLAEALGDGMVGREEDRQRYYGYILRESMRLSRLIDDLLELSRLQSGGVALKKQKFALAPMLAILAERFKERAADSGLHFALYSPAGDLPVFSNPDRIEQVLVTLLDNAVKFAPDEGLIAMRVEEQCDHYRVCVSNTGEIDAMHLPYVFDRFYKADMAHTGQGTGLGLSIAWQIMELLFEKIWAENEDGAAHFYITVHKYEGKSTREGQPCA